MHTRRGVIWLAGFAALAAITATHAEYPPFEKVSEGFEKVVSTSDGSRSLYTIYIDKKKDQLLAELPQGWKGQRYLIAATQASGSRFAGLQGPTRYVYWRQYDERLALIEPEINTRSTGEVQSKDSVERLFTDRVVLDVPIVCMGPSGQPVIDLDELLVGQGADLIGSQMNKRLVSIKEAKAFPQNIEIAVEGPDRGGMLATYHYSISLIPDSTGYKPREADERVGYFTTVYRDLGQYKEDEKWTRYIDRWHLEKRDPSLKLSPPKEPIVFYIEHTVPVRYRRWIRDGVLYWNDAFETIGLDNAIEVYYQDKATGVHMDKDPEDVRYNFIRWLNNDISTAIGPHRSHPLTGQILDADVVLTDGWIRAYWGWFESHAPLAAIESFDAQTLEWLEQYPQWDPRLLLSSPEKRDEILARRAARDRLLAMGEDVPPLPNDPALLHSDGHEEIAEWMGGEDRYCMAAHGLAFDMSFSRLNLEALELMPMMMGEEGDGDGDDDGDGDGEGEGKKKDDVQKLDGIPEWFVGPLLSELVCHEVGHTLGLRHNFKASSLYTMAEINSAEWKGKKPLAGSVMDYLPPNFNWEAGEIQGDYTMIAIGPYDAWAIEYGYTFDDPKKVAARVAEPELAYLTDDDTGGPDPFARRYDFAADPLNYAHNQIRLVNTHRASILEKLVKDGESWSNARESYQTGLNMQLRMLSMMANWVGGAHVNRDRKGDPNGRAPIEVVDMDKQQEALDFIIANTFNDEVFGLTPELLKHMTVDKWSDRSPGDRGDPTWPVHDRVMGIQASVLTMIMNPTTLQRVYDNEYRTPAGDDALTLVEVMDQVADAVYTELEIDLDGATFTDRNPMVSSLRRNLQSSMTDRLIVLASGDASMPRPIRTLAASHLRRVNEMITQLLGKRDTGQLDGYSIAHLEDLNDRITKALNRMYVENM